MFGDKNKDEKNKKTNNNKSSNDKNKESMETIIGKGTEIKGDILTKGSIRVEGKISGKINSEGSLFVGKAGIVKSEIEAEKVIIAGKIEGNIKAHEKIELLSEGQIKGDIITKILKIEEGAKFIGNSKLIDENNEKNKSTSENITELKRKKKNDGEQQPTKQKKD